MPSLFGALPIGPPAPGASLLAMSLVLWAACQTHLWGCSNLRPHVVVPSNAPPAATPPQVPEEPTAKTDPQALLMQAILTQTQALSRLLARGCAHRTPWPLSAQTRLNHQPSMGVRGAFAQDRLLHLRYSSPGTSTLESGLACRQRSRRQLSNTIACFE